MQRATFKSNQSLTSANNFALPDESRNGYRTKVGPRKMKTRNMLLPLALSMMFYAQAQSKLTSCISNFSG